MKIRWTTNSLRLRITPTELTALQACQNISLQLALPGSWKATLTSHAAKTGLEMQGDTLIFSLSAEDTIRLTMPDIEGVYFTMGDAFPMRYFVEKDFPCAHPRADEAMELSGETFIPPPDYEARKRN